LLKWSALGHFYSTWSPY